MVVSASMGWAQEKGLECPMPTGGVWRVVAPSEGKTVRLVDPDVRERWSSAAWPIGAFRCEGGGVNIADASGRLRLELDGAGSDLGQRAVVEAHLAAVEALLAKPAGTVGAEARAVSKRVGGLWNAVVGLVDKQPSALLHAGTPALMDLELREWRWPTGGRFTPEHLRDPKMWTDFSDTERGRALRAAWEKFRAQRIPLHVGPLVRLGSTPIDDLSDVVWQGESPCVAQGKKGTYRCWSPASRKWGKALTLSGEPAIGTRIGGDPVEWHGHRLELRHGAEAFYLEPDTRLMEGDDLWRRWSLEENAPSRVSLSPAGTSGVALVTNYGIEEDSFGNGRTSTSYVAKGLALFWFSTVP